MEPHFGGRRRFSEDHFDDLLNLDYWDNAGDGLGFRNLSVGDAKLDVTWIIGETKIDNDHQTAVIHKPDFRFYSIDTIMGDLNLGATFAFMPDDTKHKQLNRATASNTGMLVGTELASHFSVISNRFVVQAANGLLAGGMLIPNGDYDVQPVHDGRSIQTASMPERLLKLAEARW